MTALRPLMRTLVFLALTGDSLRADEAEESSAKAVEKLGGKVVRDEKSPDKSVVQVNLDSKPLTEDDLKQLTGLKHLQGLDLNGTRLGRCPLGKAQPECRQLAESGVGCGGRRGVMSLAIRGEWPFGLLRCRRSILLRHLFCVRFPFTARTVHGHGQRRFRLPENASV